jgi:hypothetical protein
MTSGRAPAAVLPIRAGLRGCGAAIGAETLKAHGQRLIP